MSKKQDPAKSPHGRWVLKKRRIALGIYLVFLIAAVVGTQGPWWSAYADGKPIHDEPKMGNDVGRYAWVPSGDPANPTARQENLLRPAVIAVVGCVVAFFFASYNLVADTDLQVPVLLASLLVCGVGGKVFYDVWYDQQVIKDFVVLVESKRIRKQLDTSDAVAVIDSGGKREVAPGSEGLALRFEWGLALFLSSSMVMGIDSIYMTFFAERRLGETP